MSAKPKRVVKHNDLIKARSNMTKVEHRVLAMLIADLSRDDKRFEIQRIHIRDLIERSGSTSQDLYDRGKEICERLLDQKVQIQTKQNGRRVYEGYNCLDKCRYVEGSGYIEARFNDSMKPFLLQLKEKFTIYQLEGFMRLGSRYSMRIYELLKWMEDLVWLRIRVDELREILSCEEKYARFGDFRRRVIERAQSEINEITDISFTYKVEREGQSPVRVNFMIRSGDDRPEPIPVTNADQERSDSIGVKASSNEGEEIRFNRYAMVLSELTQAELSALEEEEIRSALEEGGKRAKTSNPSACSSVVASESVRIALRQLRAN
jgi:plasmid replication initiation protein